MNVADSILELIGHTPLLRLRLTPAGSAQVLAKLEAFNPGGSVKDRLVRQAMEAGEAQGRLSPGGTLVEASAGNTGTSLSMAAAARGYRAIVVLPENAPPEQRRLLAWLGAEVVLTPASQGMAGAGQMARRIVSRNPNYFLIGQFENPANPEAHRLTTAQEILEATGGRVDAFVCGVGTGGTLTGVGERLKQEVPGVQVVAVEPTPSPLLSQGKSGPHGIPGLGPDFIPPVLKRDIIDQIITVSEEEARETAARLAREEGVLVGMSSGANVFASLKVAAALRAGKTVVTVLPDGGIRTLSPFLLKET